MNKERDIIISKALCNEDFNNLPYEVRKFISTYSEEFKIIFITQFFNTYNDLIPRKLKNDFWREWGNKILEEYEKSLKERKDLKTLKEWLENDFKN